MLLFTKFPKIMASLRSIARRSGKTGSIEGDIPAFMKKFRISSVSFNNKIHVVYLTFSWSTSLHPTPSVDWCKIVLESVI